MWLESLRSPPPPPAESLLPPPHAAAEDGHGPLEEEDSADVLQFVEAHEHTHHVGEYARALGDSVDHALMALDRTYALHVSPKLEGLAASRKAASEMLHSAEEALEPVEALGVSKETAATGLFTVLMVPVIFVAILGTQSALQVLTYATVLFAANVAGLVYFAILFGLNLAGADALVALHEYDVGTYVTYQLVCVAAFAGFVFLHCGTLFSNDLALYVPMRTVIFLLFAAHYTVAVLWPAVAYPKSVPQIDAWAYLFYAGAFGVNLNILPPDTAVASDSSDDEHAD